MLMFLIATGFYVYSQEKPGSSDRRDSIKANYPAGDSKKSKRITSNTAVGKSGHLSESVDTNELYGRNTDPLPVNNLKKSYDHHDNLYGNQIKYSPRFHPYGLDHLDPYYSNSGNSDRKSPFFLQLSNPDYNKSAFINTGNQDFKQQPYFGDLLRELMVGSGIFK